MPDKNLQRLQPGMQLQRATTDMIVREINESKRTAVLSFSSEFNVSRWWGAEILSHDPGAMDLARLLSVGTLLFNHRTDLCSVIGVPEDAWIKDLRGYARVRFDEDEDSDLVFRKVVAKTIRGVSMGYQVDSWEEVMPGKKSSNGRFTGPADIALRWAPLEISICPVPADPSVGVGRSAGFTPALTHSCRAREIELLTLRQKKEVKQ